MSIATLEDEGWVGIGTWYITHGKSRAAFIDHIRKLRPDETWPAVQGIWDRAVRAEAAAEVSQFGPFDGRISADLIPGQRPGRTGYRYIVTGTWRPSDGGKDRTLSDTIITPYQMTRDQIEARERSRGPGSDAPGLKQDSNDPRQLTWEFLGYQIQSIERW